MRGPFLRSGAITAALTVAILCAAQPAAQARDGFGVGGAAVLGAIGGLALGGAIASANRPAVYAAPRPVYVEDDYGPVCHFERRGYIDLYGYEHVRRVRVCE